MIAQGVSRRCYDVIKASIYIQGHVFFFFKKKKLAPQASRLTHIIARTIDCRHMPVAAFAYRRARSELLDGR